MQKHVAGRLGGAQKSSRGPGWAQEHQGGRQTKNDHNSTKNPENPLL